MVDERDAAREKGRAKPYGVRPSVAYGHSDRALMFNRFKGNNLCTGSIASGKSQNRIYHPVKRSTAYKVQLKFKQQNTANPIKKEIRA